MRLAEIRTSEHSIRYVVLGDDGHLVEPIARYLKQLDQRGYARNTLRAYGTSLKLFWEFLEQTERDFLDLTLDDFAAFVQWLRLPSRSTEMVPRQPLPPARSNRTINHILKAVTGFYDDLWRRDMLPTNIPEKMQVWLAPRARTYKNFLYHLTKGQPVKKHLLKQPERKRRPKTLTKVQVEQLVAACPNLRDRLLITLLYESGMRIGEVLSLWLEDIDVARYQLHVRDHGTLVNQAEIKTPAAERTIDISSELVSTILTYVAAAHTEHVHTNHVFLKLHGALAGQPLAYPDVNALFQRLKQKTGIVATAHMLRHSHFTALARQGWAPEHLRVRAGHTNFHTTYQLYVHPQPDDLRTAWEDTEAQIRLHNN